MIDASLKNRYTGESFHEGLVLTDAEGDAIDLGTLASIQVDFDFKDDRTLIRWKYPLESGYKEIELTDPSNGLMTLCIDGSDTEFFEREEVVYVSVKYTLTDACYADGVQVIENDKQKIFNLLKSRL
jgi:hypothetical protein